MASDLGPHQLYGLLRVKQKGSIVILQPYNGPKIAGPTLSVDLHRGTVEVTNRERIHLEYMEKTAFGVAGLAPLGVGFALVLIASGEKVGTVRGSAVWKLARTRVLVDPTASPAEVSQLNSQYLALVRDAFNPTGSGRGLFFSFDADITLTQQRFAASSSSLGKSSLHARADSRFVWNKSVVQSLVDQGAERFAVPLMMASFHQMTELEFGQHTGSITLIGRRGAQRAGVRHWRRGADSQGNVANFVETEQLIELTGPAGKVLSSFVQVRGSIPIQWSQIPNIKYKPPTRVAPPEVFSKAFDKHVANLLDIYKDVDAINLVNQHGSEGVLAQRFQEQADRFGKGKTGFRLIPFDFHKICGATSYDKLSLLWDQIAEDFERWGFYAEGGDGGPVRQGGVFRTNCIDCLDRTNVVQGLLGRKHLEHVLQRAGLLPVGVALQDSYPKVFNQFRVIWADHGDDVSRQYAGTGALKSGFTRTGKRTKGGLLNDGVKSVTRYYLNNFQDGAKQDAIDYVTGNFQIPKGMKSPFKFHKSPTLPLLAALCSLTWGLAMAIPVLLGRSTDSWVKILQTALLPLVVGFVTLRSVAVRGADLVRQPQLRPDLSQPW